MRLRRARIQNYRSIRDTGWFEIDDAKTILVGPNEGGKTAVLRALEQLNPGHLVRPLDPLRDFPRSEYHRIQTGALRPADVLVVEAEYDPDEDERAALAAISPLFSESRYYRAVRLDNSTVEQVLYAPTLPTVGALKDSLRRIAVHVDARVEPPPPAASDAVLPPLGPSDQLDRILHTLPDSYELTAGDAERLAGWLDIVVAPYVAEDNETEMSRLAALRESVGSVRAYSRVLEVLRRRLPVMVYVSTYPSVTPMLHLGHLADAVDAGAIDETDDYNFGNFCLLSLLRFSARQLSDLGKAPDPAFGDAEGFARYRAQLDERDAALAAASLQLTNHIRAVWQPSEGDPGDVAAGRENYAIRISADQQYLKVAVEDSLGVQIELDQRSQGFKWLVSFFVVFFAQASDRARQAVLLLDEPGMSLHGLKQREFRHTLSKLGEANQLLFTTHSPFLIGTDELNLVRVVELTDRAVGTKVRADLASEDPASLLPLREALAYDLTASLFSSHKTLILEDLTDYWYLAATAAMLEDAGMATLDSDIELIPVSSTSKIVYFSTVLEADQLQVAALLDSDASGEHSAIQQRLVETLGSRRVLRTKDSYEGPVMGPRIEELLRETLVSIGRQLGWEAMEEAGRDWGARPIGEVFAKVAGSEYTPYRLAKEYVRWTRDHRAADLTAAERIQWMGFIEKINQAFA